jgi:outer membrane biosynthesis protein TonB
MSLATILGVCAMLASAPAGGSVFSAHVVAVQAGQTGQTANPDSSPAEVKGSEQETQPAAQAKPAPPAAEKSKKKKKPKKNKKAASSTGKKTEPQPAAEAPKQGSQEKAEGQGDDAPAKVVVPNGGATDPKVQLAPKVPRQQASEQRQKINELLASSDTNLQKLSARQLSTDQQDVVRQIRVYMKQAKEAAAGSDLQRAENLATKANLLAQDLAKE